MINKKLIKFGKSMSQILGFSLMDMVTYHGSDLLVKSFVTIILIRYYFVSLIIKLSNDNKFLLKEGMCNTLCNSILFISLYILRMLDIVLLFEICMTSLYLTISFIPFMLLVMWQVVTKSVVQQVISLSFCLFILSTW